MRGNYKSPSELLLALRETGKSYWDLVGKPLTPNTGYNLNNPYAAEESEYNKWYNGSKLSDEDSEKLQLLLEEYDKDVKSNSNSLPSYKGGKDKFTTFVERMGPKVYRQLHKQGIYNPYIYDNMMRQLAWESDYGTSPLAISNHNYGGVKSSNTEYAKYKDDDAFADYYVSLIRRKYPQAVKAKDVKSYAKELKKVGYYEDSLQNYSQKLSNMSSVSRAAKLHMHTNPKQYEVEVLLDDLKNQSVQQPVSTRVEPPINKEPINKEPFVNTPIPTKAPLITRPEYLESNSLIKKSFELNMNNMLLGKDFLFKLPGFKSGKEGDLPSTYYAGTLPEVTTEAYAPIRLTTYYPVVSKYPYTGHSELKIPIDRATWYDYTGEKEFPERVLPYVTIDKKSRASDYNLVTNNCADATLNYLNKAFNTHESPMLFTTPGDVRDYAIHKLHGKLIHNNNGSDTVLIPRNARNKTKISKEALDLYSNSPKGTVRYGYNAHFKNGKDSKKSLSDEQYIKIMEDVANANYERWGYPNQDAALLYVLNANDYDYRGYYNKYPPNSANSLTHWSDEFKTAYHPSFSDESKYSGHKSKYNPDGIVGGHWYNEMFVPSFDQLAKRNKLPHFTGGKDSDIKEYASNEDMHINPDGSITTRSGNTGSVILPDVNVYAQKDYNSAFDYSGANEVMGTIADFTPVVGDVKQGLEAANDLRKGKYKEAAIGAGLLLLPNVLEKPLKYAGKAFKNLFKDTKHMFNETAMSIKNYRYPLGRPQVPNDYLTIKPQVRTRVGDVEIGAPNMAYRQGNDLGRTYQKYKDVDASVAQHQIEDNIEQLLSSRNGRPYISREKALDKAIANGTFDPAIGIEVDGHSAAYQDTPMYSDGFLWYGTPKIDETLPQGSLQSGLLVTPRNDAFIIGSNKATPYRGTGSGISRSKSGVTTVTDNGGRLIPADADNLGLELNNISAYNWEPGYGYRRVFTEEAPTIKWRDAVKSPKITSENAASTTPEVTHFYHGSPVRFDAFSADFIGSGEGGSKVMRGINLWPTERIANAPKLANIRSSDAPLHLGVPSTPLGGELNPTVYDVSGRGLKLYTTTPREVKGLSQSDLISQGYDGIQTPNQVTVFPESIGKLSIDKQSTIDQFILSHPEVERWTPWTTDKQKMQNIIDMSKMSKWTPEQWTIAQDAAIAKGDMDEVQRLRDLHFMTKAPNTVLKKEHNPLKLYHGTNNKFNSFDLDSFGSTDGGTFGRGIYTTPNESYAKLYGNNVMPLYMNLTSPRRLSHDALESIPFMEQRLAFGPDFATGNGIDGVIGTTKFKNHEGFPEYISHKASNVKSADAITYDNKGIRIPLGLRDNFKLNDIRYGLIPFGAGLTGYGLLNNHKTSRGSARKGNTKK